MAGCKKPQPEQCDRICWRYFELSFWDRFEQSVAGKPPDEVAKLRAAKEAEWTAFKEQPQNKNRDNCVMDCRANGSVDDVECIDKAETFAAAKACLGE